MCVRGDGCVLGVMGVFLGLYVCVRGDRCVLGSICAL